MFFITVHKFFEMEACLVVMVKPHPVRYSIHDLKDISSMAGLLRFDFSEDCNEFDCSIEKLLIFFIYYGKL